ncbi:MAG: ABC transporter permease [Flammeovirgaceae bacterium]|nr:ABC transporter permease [Flammeovirgaceae bacterium]
MLASYFKIVLRQLRSIYSFINLIGLIAGLSVFVLIYLWVVHELSYDRFHPKYKSTYRITKKQLNDKGEVYPIALTPGPLGPYIESTIPNIEQTCRLVQVELLLRHEEKAYYHIGLAADASLFELFKFSFQQGGINSFREGIDKIILTEKLATTYFGNSDPMGKMFTLVGRDLTVIGVIEDVPNNTHIQFDYIIPFEFLKATGLQDIDTWEWNSYHTYISLKDTKQVAVVEQKITQALVAHDPETKTQIALQPLADIHLKSAHLNNDMRNRGNFQYVLIFSGVGIFILIIASINYANLATARSLKRAKEAGVRKAIGASKMQLIIHFFSESLLYATAAFVVSLFIAWIVLPAFNELAGKPLTFDILSPGVFLPLVGSIIFCALMGGAYPALLLSSLNPALVLKGQTKSGRSTLYLRRALVVIQFILSISFLTGTFIVYQQLNFIQSRNLGFSKENILIFSSNRKLRQQYPEFKAELLAINGAKGVTATNSKLSYSDQSISSVTWEGKDPDHDVLFHQLMTDHDFVSTYSISLAEGRDFSEEISSDSNAVLLNEAAIAQMNLKEPLNKQIAMEDWQGTIIGVVKDFNFKPAQKQIEPMIIFIDAANFYEISVKLSPGNLIDQVKAVESVYKKFNPDWPFEYSFLNDDLDKLYRDEQRIGKIFKYFSILSLFISCLGLLGMVMFVTEQRAKEVALRKIMGASEIHLIWLLSGEFVLLIIIAFVIATPAMYYGSSLWLNSFVYRINPGVLLFLSAGVISLMIAWLTVGFKAYRVSRSNPIESLRNE